MGELEVESECSEGLATLACSGYTDVCAVTEITGSVDASSKYYSIELSSGMER